MQEKLIQVTNKSFKAINPKPGQTWRPFTVYTIQGNDGLIYETNDADYYKSVQIGQQVKIFYTVETKNSNGKIFTSNKLVTTKKSSSQPQGQGSEGLMARLDQMEKNIISAIRMHSSVKSEPASIMESQDTTLFDAIPDFDQEGNEDIGY